MSGGTFTPLQDVFEALGTEELAESWFESVRWGGGALCPRCSSDRCEKTRVHPTQPWYCRGCRKYFSVKVNSFMHASKLGYVKWALAIYLVVSSPKGISSTNLAKQLGITQKAAWHMGHRIREAWVQPAEQFDGVVEVDETYIGGKQRNMPKWKRRKYGRGTHGKTAVIGMKERRTNRVQAQIIANTDRNTMREYVEGNTRRSAHIVTDEHSGYDLVERKRTKVSHNKREYAVGKLHTQGIESFWAIIKRSYKGVYHRYSQQHLARYICEYTARYNGRGKPMVERMAAVVQGGVGRRLRWQDLAGCESS